MTNIESLGRCCLYRRVSTQAQVDRNASLPEQQARQIAYVTSNGGWVVGEYEDGDHGDVELRDGLQEMIAAAKLNLFDTIVVYNSDRLYRDLYLLLGFRLKMRQGGIRLASVTEPSFGGDNPDDELSVHVLGSVAQYNKSKIQSESKRGVTGAARNAHRQYGQPPYGYAWVNRKERGAGWKVNEEESVWVRQIFQWYIECVSQCEIVARLNAMGVPPPSLSKDRWRKPGGDPTTWPYATIAQMIKSRCYIGEVRVTNHVPRDRRDSPYKPPPPMWFPGSHEPIISQETHEAMQEALRVRAPKKGVRSDGIFVGGVLRCPQCLEMGVDSKMELHRSGRLQTISYWCSVAFSNRRKVALGRKDIVPSCYSYSITERKALVLLTVYLSRVVRAATARSYKQGVEEYAIIRNLEENSSPIDSAEVYRKELAALPSMRDNVKALAVRGIYSIDEAVQVIADIDAKEKDLKQRIKEATMKAIIRSIHPVNAGELLGVLSGDTEPAVKRREILKHFDALIPSADKNTISMIMRQK